VRVNRGSIMVIFMNRLDTRFRHRVDRFTRHNWVVQNIRVTQSNQLSSFHVSSVNYSVLKDRASTSCIFQKEDL
jgi:hypothetical protein